MLKLVAEVLKLEIGNYKIKNQSTIHQMSYDIEACVAALNGSGIVKHEAAHRQISPCSLLKAC